MVAIWEYALPFAGRAAVEAPVGADPVGLAVRNDGVLIVFMRVEQGRRTALHEFRVVTTGNALVQPDDPSRFGRRFVGSIWVPSILTGAHVTYLGEA